MFVKLFADKLILTIDHRPTLKTSTWELINAHSNSACNICPYKDHLRFRLIKILITKQYELAFLPPQMYTQPTNI